jgi:hypothetical protein
MKFIINSEEIFFKDFSDQKEKFMDDSELKEKQLEKDYRSAFGMEDV